MKKDREKQKVFVGLSGGVDSSVSAALLQEAGYDVTGAFIRVWNPDWLECNWREERRDAMRVAAHLNIPFITIDLQEEYKTYVADYMLSEYQAGRTPNPDVMCNKEIKFGAFLKKAREMSADFIATGHYAITPALRATPLNIRGEKEVVLKESSDKNKDQSYFLWTLTQDQLQHVLFPVGHLQKEEVRKLAKKFKLPTAEKKDSQGICFLGKVDMKEFLSHYIEAKLGDVLDESGKVIGSHDGAMFYTIGQRHGFTISHTTPHDDAFYIIKKDINKNTLTVSHKNSYNKLKEESLQQANTVSLSHVNWISGQAPDFSKKYSARIRYRQQKQDCEIKINKRDKEENIIIHFLNSQEGVSSGQSVVLYDKNVCLGGGIIEEIQ